MESSKDKVVWTYRTRVFALKQEDSPWDNARWFGLELENTNNIWWDTKPFDLKPGDHIKITVEKVEAKCPT